MKTRALPCILSLFVALVFCGVVAAGSSGLVVNSRFFPLPGAQACLVEGDKTGTCSLTDGGGEYFLPDSEMSMVRITLDGYIAVLVPAVDQVKPVMMERFASLMVLVVHGSTGEPLSGGEFWITNASGGRSGPFPVAAGGSRIKSQLPGEVAIRVQVPGYSQERVVFVELHSGMESRVDVPLVPVSSAR